MSEEYDKLINKLLKILSETPWYNVSKIIYLKHELNTLKELKNKLKR